MAAGIHRETLCEGTIKPLHLSICLGPISAREGLAVFIRKQTSPNRLERKLDPWSDKSTRGAPWQLTISFTKISAMVLASIFDMAKASVHFLHISTKTNMSQLLWWVTGHGPLILQLTLSNGTLTGIGRSSAVWGTSWLNVYSSSTNAEHPCTSYAKNSDLEAWHRFCLLRGDHQLVDHVHL